MLNIKPRTKGGTLLIDVRILDVVHAGTDVYGNPYYAVVTENDGDFRTMIGAACNYAMTNYARRNAPRVCLELTRNGRIRYVTPMNRVSAVYGTKEN